MFDYYRGEGVDYWMSERTIKFCATHWHKFYEVEFILEGNGSEYINGVRYDVARGSLTIMPPNAFHSYSNSDSSITLSTFCFTPRFLSTEIRQQLHDAKLPWLFQFDDACTKRMIHWLRELKESMSADSPNRNAIVRRMIELILLRLHPTNNLTKNELSPDDEQIRILRTILKYIDEHYAERINRDALAEALHYSASYFSSLFHKLSGITLSEHITNVRMNKAMELLIDSEMPIADVIKHVGYRSESLFYRAFSERFGTNPRHIRKQKEGTVLSCLPPAEAGFHQNTSANQK